MINCISKKLPGNQQSVDLIFEYLSTLYTEYQNAEKKQRYSQDRSEMITKIAQIITEGVSSVGPELEGAVAGAPSFVEEASFHLIGIIRQRLLQDHSTPSASVFTTLTRNEQSLWDVLELMRFGRFTVAARKIASCWAPDDSLIIATSGLDVYHEQLRGGNYGEDAMNVQFATLTQSKIQDRTVDVKNASAETIQQWATTIHPPPTKENYKDLVEKSNDLYSMHHMMLTPSITNDTMEVDDLVKEDTPALSENELEDENHLILIFPYYGNVWEVDSLDETGPLNLGPCGDNWVDSALPRLVQWKNTVQKTSTPVDIQAILKV
ncbi:hypothetical protein BGZ46_001612 [Entomortierella lignicola]|nr:hypothetical protein BGZ46_001612 [Entomortierella lignicola]